MPPALSILTPTWNRASYLERVWSGLMEQTTTDFEWIVADDGSDDDTESTVRRLAANSHFPVLYIRANAHVGKTHIDNEAIAHARGELTLWCDSDDKLLPEAVERIIDTWHMIPAEERLFLSGLTALAATEDGIIVDPFGSILSDKVSWNDLSQVFNVESDMLFIAKTSLLKRNKFPECDLLIPESCVWNKIGHDKSIIIRDVLLYKEYLKENGISFSRKMSYNRGRAFSLSITTKELKAYSFSPSQKLFGIINFIRYSRHAEMDARFARRLWGKNSSSFVFWALFPLAWLIALRDVIQGKVVRSHREFLANRHAQINAIWLRGGGL